MFFQCASLKSIVCFVSMFYQIFMILCTSLGDPKRLHSVGATSDHFNADVGGLARDGRSEG